MRPRFDYFFTETPILGLRINFNACGVPQIVFVAVIATMLCMESGCAATGGILANKKPRTAMNSNSEYFTVMSYGARGDGQTDDTHAFRALWKEACSAASDAVLAVPSGKTFLLNSITFSGPCKSPITVEIAGTIVARSEQFAWKKNNPFWLLFTAVSGLTLKGGGTIDGQGSVWWDKSCKVNKKNACIRAPPAISIIACMDVSVTDIRFINSPEFHLAFDSCSTVEVSGLTMQAPEDSPNTDGIHTELTRDVHINNCSIETGDDCISIGSGCSNIEISNIKCGPGHGISIGSLGKAKERASVKGISVNNVVFIGTQNGVRIKTWQGGSGYAKDIVFENIRLINVMNPIFIDQYYCDSFQPCTNQSSAVQIENVAYKNIKGTAIGNGNSVNFACSKSLACKGILMSDVKIVSSTRSKTQSTCFNAFGSVDGTVIPRSCLIPES